MRAREEAPHPLRQFFCFAKAEATNASVQCPVVLKLDVLMQSNSTNTKRNNVCIFFGYNYKIIYM